MIKEEFLQHFLLLIDFIQLGEQQLSVVSFNIYM